MTTSTLVNIVVVVAVVIYVIYRRMTWNELDPKEAWGGPLTLIGIGLLQMRHLKIGVSGVDIAFLAIGLVVALIGGALMGALTQLDRRGDRTYQRIGAIGLVAWIGLLLVRGVLGIIGHFAGATLTSGGGSIMLSLGANLLAMSLVLSARTGTLAPRGPAPR